MNKDEITIFIVEDNRFYTEIVRDTLIREGYTNIESFKSGKECFDCKGKFPDIVILDYQLDEMSGIEIIRQIKAHNDITEVIFLSGQESMDVVVDSMKYGAFDYIDKTDVHAMARLSVMIEKILLHHRSSRREMAINKLKDWFLIF